MKMEINHDAKVKIFLVMPFMDGMSDVDGGKPEFEFPHLDYCTVHFSKDEAEQALLKMQKSDPDATYIILESITFAAKHENLNEYCLADTVQW
jgi:hypothetical protein